MTEAQPDAPLRPDTDVVGGVAFSRADGMRVLGTLGLVLGGFTFVASLILVLYTHQHPAQDVIQSPGGLLLRVVLFGGLTTLSGGVLWWYRELRPCDASHVPDQRISRGSWFVLLLLLALAALLLGLQLDRYPWAAPDEIHHLNVARNLAVHGAYASGNPESGFTYFDSFDSVGPTVLLPVALALKAGGASLVAGRFVMPFFFLMLCLAGFQFCRMLYGAWSGVAAVAFLLATFSSIYLGRTVYGEVPAFAFLLCGLITWHRALALPGWSGWGLATGLLMAAAVLSKTIVVLVIFSLAGAWAYDRVRHRQIRWAHIVTPALSGLALLLVWKGFQHFHGGESADDGGVLTIYQHYLLFGISSTPFAIANSVVLNPVAHLGWLVIAVISVPLVFRQRYAPAAVALYLYALFMLYWWFFFTPGQLHRYLWNAYAILGLFAAPWLVTGVQYVMNTQQAKARRALCLVALVLLVGPGIRWVGLQAAEVVTKDEMADDWALLEAIEALPPTQQVGTTRGRLPGVVQFFTGRAIRSHDEVEELWPQCDVLILPDTPAHRARVPEGQRLNSAGGFVLLSTAKTTE